MQRRTQYLLAATLITTLVCLDRVTLAESGQHAPVRTAARSIVGKLTFSFRKVVPITAMPRVLGRALRTDCGLRPAFAQSHQHPTGNLTYQFRLPPPAF